MLRSLAASHVLFVGDFANEDAEFVRTIQGQLRAAGLPFSAVLGNHDAWASTIATVAGTIPKRQVCGWDNTSTAARIVHGSERTAQDNAHRSSDCMIVFQRM